MNNIVTLKSDFKQIALTKELPPFDPSVGCYMLQHHELELEGWRELVLDILKVWGQDIYITPEYSFFVTLDQRSLKAGESHRRLGPHYDGYWMNSYRSDPRWNTVSHELVNKSGIILLSSHLGSVGYRGEVETYLTEGGDCSHIAEELKSFKREPLEAHKIYLGNGHFIHESVPVDKDCDRQLLRITICRNPR